ncbi:MAG TPA: prepilin-type N-terminal cleavage/methylation domain-containing protein [Planctomycetota bacterium]|nr:prepilin-type N-terminal cleavage/methylation domain-containing protein [Planctomycetota bacterium]
MNRPRSAAGFSLIEMLIVIGIAGILGGLLIPVVMAAHSKAHDVECASNLKGIGTALMLFVHQTGYLPASGPDPDTAPGADDCTTWYRAILPYAQNWRIFTCPSKHPSVLDVPEAQPGPGPTPPGMKFNEVHYGLNFQFPATEADPAYGLDRDHDLMGASVQIDIVAAPSRVILVADAAVFESVGPGNDINPKTEQPASVIDGAMYFPDEDGKLPTGKPVIAPRHGGSATCLFVDGHVQQLNAREILSKKRDDPGCLYVGRLVE